MSDYVSHLFGYFLKLFKTDSNSRNKDPRASLRRSNSVRELYVKKSAIKKKPPDTDSSLHQPLKRNNSCPILKITNPQSVGENQRCKTCSDKLNLKDSAGDTEQRNNKSILQEKAVESNEKEIKIDSPLSRVRSIDLQNNSCLIGTDPQVPTRKQRSPFLLSSGDGNLPFHAVLKQNYELNSNQGTKDKIDVNGNIIENGNARFSTYAYNFPFHNKEEIGDNNWSRKYDDEEETLTGLMCSCKACRACRSSYEKELERNRIAQEFCKMDYFKPEKNKDCDPWKYIFPENPYLEPLQSPPKQSLFEERLNGPLLQEHQKDSPHFNRVSPCKMKNLSQNNNFNKNTTQESPAKSKIPVPQHRINNISKVLSSVQTGWKSASRTNLFDWSTRNWNNRYRIKARKAYSSTSIAERSMLNVKFDRMFRQFSKKIYRGNIIDHYSHSRWMRLAGILEEVDAANFKSYAKRKVVLTLSEYKQALVYICKTQGYDYWELLKKMTNIKIRETSSTGENDERSIESKEDLRFGVFAR